MEPKATHHVVIQDDVRPCPDFADHLRSVIQLRPDRAIALYVNWNSPENSYLSRRAVTLGSSWAPLSPLEYTPTLGLVLPAEWARQLGSYLFELPDSLRDDDEMVTRFCRERGIPVIAALPTLLDHGAGSSLAGNETHGERRSVLFAGDLAQGTARWNPVHPSEPELVRRRDRSTVTEFVVELVNSTCRLRFTRPGAGEAVDHLYGWYWQDWTELIGVDRGHVRAAWEEFVGDQRSVASLWDDGYAYEVWAAGYLLGADAAGGPSFPGTVEASGDPAVLRYTLTAWVESGLTLSDRDARGPAGIAMLVDIASAAVDRGAAADGRMEEPRRKTVEGATAFPGDAVRADRDIDNALRAMADREAEACLLLAPSVDVPTPLLHMRVEKCPECGADRDTLRAHSTAVPTRVAALLAADEEPSGPGNVLTLLGCEVLPTRALLPAVLAEPAPGGRLRFKTRAAVLTELTGSPVVAPADLSKLVPAMASMERSSARAGLAAAATPVSDDGAYVVLPALTRFNPLASAGGGSRRPAGAHPLTPHPDAPALRSLGRAYRTYLLDAVRSRLG
ncbi:hypothetical protein [Streptomyces sp. MW-W600-10]|uniref:hypothetical protein n=1 Tax=Streptomyces sp. MW-W600-10 TaxID=2829819 RepID=UPI001C465EF8|nr:hypothetical protein [Streptomyces sp. MW-W600-10]MBV7245819.1 hypothetical protein [Streptomyces sp. MW-W600-10]